MVLELHMLVTFFIIHTSQSPLHLLNIGDYKLSLIMMTIKFLSHEIHSESRSITNRSYDQKTV